MLVWKKGKKSSEHKRIRSKHFIFFDEQRWGTIFPRYRLLIPWNDNQAFEGGAITGKSATRSGLAKSFRRRKDCSPRAEQGETFRPNSLERHEKASFLPVGTGRVQRPRSTRRRITSHHPPPNVAVRMEEIGKQQKNNGARRRVCIHLYTQILITHSFVTEEFSIEEFRNLGDI